MVTYCAKEEVLTGKHLCPTGAGGKGSETVPVGGGRCWEAARWPSGNWTVLGALVRGPGPGMALVSCHYFPGPWSAGKPGSVASFALEDVFLESRPRLLISMAAFP